MRPTSWLLVTMAIGGCASSQPQQAAIELDPPSATAVAPDSPAPLADDPPLPLERRAERALCEGRDGCALLKLRKAGTRGDETLLVAFVEHPKEEQGRAAKPASPRAPLTTDGENEVLAAEYGGCTNIEVWLLSEKRRELVREQLLGEVCNDGYGASGVGEDTFSFDEKGTLEHSRYGGSAWRWNNATTLTLDPPTILKSAWGGHWNIAENSETSTFDYRTFIGRTEWEAPACDPAGAPPSQGGPVESFAYAAIPVLDPKAITGDLAKTPLGTCAAVIDGDKLGFEISGSGPASSSRMKIVAVGNRLHVEVEDDKFVETGAKKDEIEIWLARSPASYFEHCLPKQSPLSGFAIPIGPGNVRKLGGKLATPDVTRDASKGPTRRVAIEIPPKMEGITLVYRDTDDGKTVARAIATSDLDTKKEASVGRLQKVEAARAGCTASDGKMTIVLPRVTGDTPLFGL